MNHTGFLIPVTLVLIQEFLGLLLINNHRSSKSALGRFAIRVDIIVAPDPIIAVLLNVLVARAAAPATSDEHAYSNSVSHIELGDIGSNLHNFTNHFMSLSQPKKFKRDKIIR